MARTVKKDLITGENIVNKIIKTGLVRWRDMEFIQDANFKSITREQLNKLKESIKNRGFIESFMVWQNKDVIVCLDGYHRTLALEELSEEGYKVPEEFTANFLDIKNKKEAAEYVLAYSSLFAHITNDGLYEFASQYMIDLSVIKLEIDLPYLDLNEVSQGDIQKQTVEKSVKTESIKDYRRTHILISVPLNSYMKVQDVIKQLENIKGIEIEKTTN